DVERLGGDVDAAEQRKLQQLQVALVAGGQLGADRQRLGQAGKRGGAARAHQLEQVRIALLRHDRGAGGECIGQLDEGEFAGVEQQQVGGHAPQVLHQQAELEQQVRL